MHNFLSFFNTSLENFLDSFKYHENFVLKFTLKCVWTVLLTDLKKTLILSKQKCYSFKKDYSFLEKQCLL